MSYTDKSAVIYTTQWKPITNIQKCYEAEHTELCDRIFKARFSSMSLEELLTYRRSSSIADDLPPWQSYNALTKSVD